MRRVVFVCLLTLALILAAPPASLVDAAIAHASANRVRLAEASGSLWSGGGRLANSHGERLPVPWLALGWRFEPGALASGRLVWRLSIDGRPALRIALGAGGMEIQEIELDLPAGPLFAALPQPVFQLGWHGRLGARGEHFACDWQGRCKGNLELNWRGAATDILPDRRLGDYRGALNADGEGFRLMLSSPTDNALRVDGQVSARADGVPALDLILAGDPLIVDRLPAMLDGQTRREADGRLRVVR